MKTRQTVKIDKFIVGDDHPVCVVAELGVNHLGDYERMKDMIFAAHEAGADLLKFQTYLAEKRYDSIKNPKGKQFIEMLAKWEFTRDQEARLWEYASSLGATVFTSPFDADSVNFADQLGSVAFKVAAFEAVNHELLRAISEKNKPVVMSRGMTTYDELVSAVNIFKSYDVPHVLLHTISSYPVMKRHSHLKMIPIMRSQFECPIGHSDHTRGTDIPPLAVAAGANMIEKHFTINPKLRESDNPFSITPDELEELIFKVRQAEKYLGTGKITKVPTEQYMWDFRRVTT